MPRAGLADSMYAGTVFLGGKHGELGADAVFEEVTADDRELIGALARALEGGRAAGRLSQTGRRQAALELPANERDLWKSASVTPISSCIAEKVAAGRSTELTPQLAPRRVNGAWLHSSWWRDPSRTQSIHNP